jgi:hyaluronoglucosaminidase
MTELGIIEGYYGRPWSWEDRSATMAFLAQHGYRFYMFCPKADIYLRRKWRELHPPEDVARLTELSARCRENGVRFGVGLSPTKLHLDFGAEAKSILARKIDSLEALGLDDFALLFDDMKGDVPNLAQLQADVIHWTRDHLKTDRFLVCPSYYTDDPILDRVFGQRPDNYVEDFGRLVDRSIDVFWTGEEVISRQFSRGHLERVSELLQRKPFIWDNYPVNDGERMSNYLHLRGVTGRPAAMGELIAAHGINPALQPTLARIPALTLYESYQQGDQYQYLQSYRRACNEVLGSNVGQLVYEDLLFLHDYGLHSLGKREETLRGRYTDVDNPGAREIIEWLNGGYRITDEIIRAQSGDE